MITPKWLTDIQSNAPTSIRAEVAAVVAAQLTYYASIANYEKAVDAGDDTNAEMINGLPHPDNVADELDSALEALDAADPAFCARYRAAEEKAEAAQAEAAVAQRPAWLAEIYAVAEVRAAEDIRRLIAAEHRVNSAEEAGDWHAWAAAEHERAVIDAEVFGGEDDAGTSALVNSALGPSPEEVARQARFDEREAERRAVEVWLAKIGATEEDQIVTAICLHTPRAALTASPFANPQLKKFTERDVAEIRASTETHRATGALYGLSEWQVGRIKRALITRGTCGRCRIPHAFLSDTKTLATIRARVRKLGGARRRRSET